MISNDVVPTGKMIYTNDVSPTGKEKMLCGNDVSPSVPPPREHLRKRWLTIMKFLLRKIDMA